jgi:hypothetical protein
MAVGLHPVVLRAASAGGVDQPERGTTFAFFID